jgi:hypothetical protein
MMTASGFGVWGGGQRGRAAVLGFFRGLASSGKLLPKSYSCAGGTTAVSVV